MIDYSKLINDYHAGLSDPNLNLPEHEHRFAALVDACTTGGTLSAKATEMIALTLAIASGCEASVAHHAKAALKAGATRNEIAALIGITITMGCGPASVYGVEALRAYDGVVDPTD